MAVTVCLGCGGEHAAEMECMTCHQRLMRCLDVFKHWPLETSLSPAALLAVGEAIANWLIYEQDGNPQSRVVGELESLQAHINAYLQHVIGGREAFKLEPTDEELLS